MMVTCILDLNSSWCNAKIFKAKLNINFAFNDSSLFGDMKYTKALVGLGVNTIAPKETVKNSIKKCLI